MPISKYPGGFSNGVAVLGVPTIWEFPGHVFWVDSNTGSDSSGQNGDFDHPFATVDYAVGNCTASNGDVIFVMPGHAENIAATDGTDWDHDVAGVSVIGLGSGAARPTFTMTATGAYVDIAAADALLRNLVFKTTANGVTVGIDINAIGATLDRLEFGPDSTTDQHFLTPVKSTGTADNAADDLTVTNCVWTSIDSGALEFIELNADVARMVVTGNTIVANASTATGVLMFNATGKSMQDAFVAFNNTVSATAAADIMIDNDQADNTGFVAHNTYAHVDTDSASGIDFDGVGMFENYSNSATSTGGILLPAADS